MAFGYVGPVFTGEEEVVWKCEGAGDTASLLSLDLPPGHIAISNGCGAQEKPPAWFLNRFASVKRAFVVGDCDEAGQAGAIGTSDQPGYARLIASHAAECRNVVLPYPIIARKGKDLSNWIQEQRSSRKANAAIYSELLELAEQQPVVEPVEHNDDVQPKVSMSGAAGKPPTDDNAIESDFANEGDDDDDSDDDTASLVVLEDDDDPHRLARLNLIQYESSHGGTVIFWRQQWWKYRDGRYRNIEKEEFVAKVTGAIRREFENIWQNEKADYDEWLESADYDERNDKGPPVCNKVKTGIINNVLAAIKSMCVLSGNIDMFTYLPDRSKPHYISVKNGILDLDAVFKNSDQCLLPHTKDWFSSVRLDYNFDPAATCETWMDYIGYCMDGDQQRIDILQEWAGYLLTGQNDQQKFLALEGEGNNGKTVYFAAMTAMLGSENVSNLSLENFGSQFGLSTTIGKAANISGDVGDMKAISEGQLKQFTGGDTMYIDRKGINGVSDRPTAKLMVAWNARPHIQDKTNGMWRRILLVPFQRPVDKGRRVKNMDKPEWWTKKGETPGILRWAILGLERLRNQGEFTVSDISDRAMRDYKKETNSTLRFLMEHVEKLPPDQMKIQECLNPSDQAAINANDLFKRYKDWCEEEIAKPVSKSNFGIQIRRTFGNIRHQRRSSFGRYYVYRLIRYQETEDE